MQTITLSIDYFLYALVLITIALSCGKAVFLYFPRLLGQPSFPDQLGLTEDAMQSRLESLESGLVLLAVIGVAAPFIGLTGTVMHIIEALRQLGGGAVDMSLVSGPIATALNTTLVGLLSAIPAVAAHALLQRRVELLESRHRRHLRAIASASA
jgi:biopolymer transport protein ExbB/TolQ